MTATIEHVFYILRISLSTLGFSETPKLFPSSQVEPWHDACRSGYIKVSDFTIYPLEWDIPSVTGEPSAKQSGWVVEEDIIIPGRGPSFSDGGEPPSSDVREVDRSTSPVAVIRSLLHQMLARRVDVVFEGAGLEHVLSIGEGDYVRITGNTVDLPDVIKYNVPNGSVGKVVKCIPESGLHYVRFKVGYGGYISISLLCPASFDEIESVKDDEILNAPPTPDENGFGWNGDRYISPRTFKIIGRTPEGTLRVKTVLVTKRDNENEKVIDNSPEEFGLDRMTNDELVAIGVLRPTA